MPVGEIEATVADSMDAIVRVLHLVEVRTGGGGVSHDVVVSVEVDADLERDGPGAGCGVGCLGCQGVEIRAADSVCRESPSGADGWLEGDNVEVVSTPQGAARNGVEGGHSGAGGADGVCLSGADTASTHSEGGESGGRGHDLRGVADGAVATRPPDADVVVLAAQVVLTGRHGARARVPVEAGDCTLAG